MLAIDGGEPVRRKPFPVYNTIGDDEKRVVMEVLDSGVLSKYLGKWGDDFYGGPRVKMLEREWARYFGVNHASAMNSATSCLYAAVGAVGVEPGDEVIVTPYSMSASVTGVEVYGGRPVFADIDPQTLCITPDTIAPLVTARTKAIIVVDLFGHPCDIDGIMALADNEGIYVIEDAAQAPGARYSNYHGNNISKYAGTGADIGVFSLNYHKTIHCGEGGVAVTNHGELVKRLDLIRNHGEAVVADMGRGDDLGHIKGFNFRMPEIEAAIAFQQLRKLDELLKARQHAAGYLTEQLYDLYPSIESPRDCHISNHAYYVYPILVNSIKRDALVDALLAEGIPVTKGYVRPLYREPLFGGRKSLPVVEDIQSRLITTNVCHYNVTREDLDDVVTAFHKVIGDERCRITR